MNTVIVRNDLQKFCVAWRRLRWVILLIAVTDVFAEEAARKSFDLPVDTAEKSLKKFSEQSGMEVLVPTSAVKDIRTRAVKGEMTAREALDSMLVGTPLIAVANYKTGSVTIRREGPNGPNVPRAAQTQSDRPRSEKSPMVPRMPQNP